MNRKEENDCSIYKCVNECTLQITHKYFKKEFIMKCTSNHLNYRYNDDILANELFKIENLNNIKNNIFCIKYKGEEFEDLNKRIAYIYANGITNLSYERKYVLPEDTNKKYYPDNDVSTTCMDFFMFYKEEMKWKFKEDLQNPTN